MDDLSAGFDGAKRQKTTHNAVRSTTAHPAASDLSPAGDGSLGAPGDTHPPDLVHVGTSRRLGQATTFTSRDSRHSVHGYSGPNHCFACDCTLDAVGGAMPRLGSQLLCKHAKEEMETAKGGSPHPSASHFVPVSITMDPEVEQFLPQFCSKRCKDKAGSGKW